MLRNIRLTALQIVLIFLISVVSTYELPDFSQLNNDIVLFLTPYGIIENFTAQDSALRPFYFEISKGHEQLTTLKLSLIGLLFSIMLLNFS